jgi:hypothetical protein
MGIFDYLSQSGANGLLGGLYNPLMYPPQSGQNIPFLQPQYDQLGVPFAAPQQTPLDPFGPAPNLAEWAKQFAPQTPFNNGAAPLAGFSAPQAPAQQAPSPFDNPQQPYSSGQTQQPQAGLASMGNYGGTPFPIFGQQDQGSLPQAATPVQYQGQPQQTRPQIPAALGGANESAGIGDRLSAGLNGLANSDGFLPAISNLVSGLATGQRNDAAGMKQDNLRAQYQATRQALIDNGMPASQASSTAMLSVFNPEAAKTILPEALSNKEKYQVVSDDPLSGKKYGFVNERTQTVNGQTLGAQSSGQSGSLQSLQDAQARGVTGDALYDALPKSMAPTVKAMIEGRQPLPSTTAMRSPATLALIDAAHAIDPTFDATTWASRLAGRKDFEGGGKSSEMVRAANQTLAHVGSLLTAMDNLKNTRIPIYNSVANTVSENLGTGEQGAFRTNAHAVAEEMSKVFKGANMSDSEIRSWEQNLSENMSPAQQRAQIAKLSELLHGSLQALEEKRLQSIGPMAAAKSGPLIKPEGQAVLQRIDKWLAGNGANQPQPALPSGWSVRVR